MNFHSATTFVDDFGNELVDFHAATISYGALAAFISDGLNNGH